MKPQRVFVLVDMDELDADVQVQAVMLAARWVYFEPRFVYEPSKKPPFLRDDSKIKESVPKRCP